MSCQGFLFHDVLSLFGNLLASHAQVEETVHIWVVFLHLCRLVQIGIGFSVLFQVIIAQSYDEVRLKIVESIGYKLLVSRDGLLVSKL